MADSTRAGIGEDVREKLRELAWFALMGFLRWLIERLTRGNPGDEQDDAAGE